MQRAWMGVILCVIAMIGLPQGGVSAQEIPTPVGWEMGLVYADGASEDNPFILEEGETTIRFWIRNDNLAGDIDVALDYDSSSSATLSGEETVTVGSASNDTFTLKISNIDLWRIPSGTIYDFEIEGQLVSWGLAPIVAPVSNQNIDGEAMVPELYRWGVEITEIEHTISAGTEFNLQVDFRNIGNTADKLQSVTIEDDCPVLTSDDENWFDNGLEGPLIQPSEAISTTIVFDASSTHPTRLCEIEITVRSTGVANGGLGDSSNKGETVVNVEARPVGAQVDQDEADVGDNDGPQNQDQVTRDNFLGFPSLLTPLAIASAAWFQSRRN
ncbi:MAG: hypothetical protein Ct9H90mP16_00330 [Candidatus Poseidoniales archaeon]|nr:MAG: hypothetical protein Ct9H90mP16_00330 [Candidatus Poseidoniales archaeon]